MARFRDRLFVLNIDSTVLAADAFSNLLLDISVLRSLNINVVIVHGASQRVGALAERMAVDASNLDGMGITNSETLELAVLAGNRFAHDILGGLTETNVRAAVTNAIVAHPAGIRGGRDHEYTGKVERVDADFLWDLLQDGIVPVIPPLGFDGNGQTYRVNSDQAARKVAEALKAAKLMFVTTSNGVQGGGTLSTQFSVAEAEAYLQHNGGELPPEMHSKLEHGLRACKNGVLRVHIIDGQQDEALLGEVFSNEGVGTMIYANEYQSIRPAHSRDAGVILAMIRDAVADEELLPRSHQEVTEQIANFYVFEIDRNVVACAGLEVYPAERCAELQCLFVADAHANQGIGKKMTQFMIDRAHELGCTSLFALSTQAFNYFRQKGGFHEGQSTDLPERRRQTYEQSGRKSRILVRTLTAE